MQREGETNRWEGRFKEKINIRVKYAYNHLTWNENWMTREQLQGGELKVCLSLITRKYISLKYFVVLSFPLRCINWKKQHGSHISVYRYQLILHCWILLDFNLNLFLINLDESQPLEDKSKVVCVPWLTCQFIALSRYRLPSNSLASKAHVDSVGSVLG